MDLPAEANGSSGRGQWRGQWIFRQRPMDLPAEAKRSSGRGQRIFRLRPNTTTVTRQQNISVWQSDTVNVPCDQTFRICLHLAATLSARIISTAKSRTHSLFVDVGTACIAHEGFCRHFEACIKLSTFDSHCFLCSR